MTIHYELSNFGKENYFQRIIRRIGWGKIPELVLPTVMMAFQEVGMFRIMHLF
jgi:hypothetical protein